MDEKLMKYLGSELNKKKSRFYRIKIYFIRLFNKLKYLFTF